MNDRPISMTTTAAVLIWIASGAAMIVGLVLSAPHWIFAGLWLCGLGIVASIRMMLCGLHRRELQAFELGREVAAESKGPRPVR